MTGAAQTAGGFRANIRRKPLVGIAWGASWSGLALIIGLVRYAPWQPGQYRFL